MRRQSPAAEAASRALQMAQAPLVRGLGVWGGRILLSRQQQPTEPWWWKQRVKLMEMAPLLHKEPLAKGLGAPSLSCLLRAMTSSTAGEERKGEVGVAQPQPPHHVLTHSSEVSPGHGSHPKGEEGENVMPRPRALPGPGKHLGLTQQPRGLGRERI